MSSFMEADGKVLQPSDNGIAINILFEAHTSIIKVLRLDGTQNLNEVRMFSIIASIIAEQ